MFLSEPGTHLCHYL